MRKAAQAKAVEAKAKEEAKERQKEQQLQFAHLQIQRQQDVIEELRHGAAGSSSSSGGHIPQLQLQDTKHKARPATKPACAKPQPKSVFKRRSIPRAKPIPFCIPPPPPPAGEVVKPAWAAPFSKYSAMTKPSEPPPALPGTMFYNTESRQWEMS